MARARKYPPANTTAQWFEDKFSRTTMNPVSKLLLHTTETAGWPGYGGGASAPTITYHPWLPAGQRWRQHNYIDRSARALRDPSGTAVRENQDGVVQVEIICYCDPKLYAKYGKGVNKLPDSFYEDMGAFLAFLHTEYAVPLVRAPEWDTFPPSDSIRMSGPQYDAFRGVLGHQHASGNTHGDPGMTNAQVDRILTVAKRIVAPPKPAPKPPAQEDEMFDTQELDQIKVAAGQGVHGQRIGRSDLTIALAVEGSYYAARAAQATATATAKAIADLAGAVAALSRQVVAEDTADDAEFRASMTKLDGTLAELKAAVQAASEEPPKA